MWHDSYPWGDMGHMPEQGEWEQWLISGEWRILGKPAGVQDSEQD